MSDGPSPGRVLFGTFLIVGGICLVVLGGGCTISVLGELGSPRGELDLTGLVLTVSLLMLAVGGLMIWGGVKLLKPRDE